MSYEGKPQPFASDDLGRGRTLDEAINDAIKKQSRSHGEVFEVRIFVTVSNPHVGEYIVDLS